MKASFEFLLCAYVEKETCIFTELALLDFHVVKQIAGKKTTRGRIFQDDDGPVGLLYHGNGRYLLRHADRHLFRQL